MTLTLIFAALSLVEFSSLGVTMSSSSNTDGISIQTEKYKDNWIGSEKLLEYLSPEEADLIKVTHTPLGHILHNDTDRVPEIITVRPRLDEVSPFPPALNEPPSFASYARCPDSDAKRRRNRRGRRNKGAPFNISKPTPPQRADQNESDYQHTLLILAKTLLQLGNTLDVISKTLLVMAAKKEADVIF